jgi:DNA adenine methylase
MMRFECPHPIPYQGSKRLLAPAILSFVRKGDFSRLIEPFAGSAAITLAAAKRNLFQEYVIADVLRPLTDIWRLVLDHPKRLSEDYRKLWESQHKTNSGARFNQIRAEFNNDQDPAKLLYLLARCVKNAVRFSTKGEFNQSPDNRRQGMRPDTMGAEIHAAHQLLRGKTEIICGDFRNVLKMANESDVVYMDPPYQGVTNTRDRRYIQGVPRTDMIGVLRELNERSVQYVLSYDGHCGGKTYGEPLPLDLGAHRLLLETGRSSQATLSGRDHVTVESIYLSPGLWTPSTPTQAQLKTFEPQADLFP